MDSDIWKNIYFWSDYGETCNQANDEKIKEELKKVIRIVVESGRDMSEENWLDVAYKAKSLFGSKAVLDVIIRKKLIGGGRIIINGLVTDNTVLAKYHMWKDHGKSV